MKVTLSQLEAFYWIAQLGSFRAAASRLNLTQPTISLRMRALEQALGVRLFERAGRHIRLTVDASMLLPRAERMLALLDELGSNDALADPLRGRLRLGAPDSFGLTSMPALLGALRKRHPKINLALTIDNSAVLSAKLNERELDVAFVVDPQVEAHIRIEPIGAVSHAWVASPNLPLPRRVVRPEDLVDREIFTNPAPSNLMTMVRGWFAGAGLEPSRLSTCNSLSVILRLTAAGEGVSLLPTAILSTELAAGTIRALRGRPEIARPRLFAAYQADKAGRELKALLETARHAMARAGLLAAG